MTVPPLLLGEPVLLVYPTLACKVGLEEAIVLQQLHLLIASGRRPSENRDGLRWLPMRLEELGDEFPWLAQRTLKRVLATLRRSGYLHVRRGQHGNAYAIDYDAVEALR